MPSLQPTSNKHILSLLKNSYHGPTMCQTLSTKDAKDFLNSHLFYSRSTISLKYLLYTYYSSKFWDEALIKAKLTLSKSEEMPELKPRW